MECFLCSKEQGAGGELPVCVHTNGKLAHEQCFVKWRAFATLNGGTSEDTSGYTYDWISNVYKYLPAEMAAIVKPSQE